MSKPITTNTLFYGDNLPILREHLADDAKGAPKSVIVQVKSGHINSGLIRDLVGTLKRENAALGVFVTLEEPSKDMLREAASADFYVSELWQKSYPKIQILT